MGSETRRWCVGSCTDQPGPCELVRRCERHESAERRPQAEISVDKVEYSPHGSDVVRLYGYCPFVVVATQTARERKRQKWQGGICMRQTYRRRHSSERQWQHARSGRYALYSVWLRRSRAKHI